MVEYVTADKDANLAKLRLGITALGINPPSTTTRADILRIQGAHRAIYEGNGLVVVNQAVHFKSKEGKGAKYYIQNLAKDKDAVISAVERGNFGLLEILEAAEDVGLSTAQRKNLIYGLIEAISKVAIAGAGFANNLSDELKVDVGDLNGKLLSGMRKLDDERPGDKRYISPSKKANLANMRLGLTALGLNSTGGTEGGEIKIVEKAHKAIYEGQGEVVLSSVMKFMVDKKGSRDHIIELAGDKTKLYAAVQNGNFGLLELLAAVEDNGISKIERKNMLPALVEAIIKVAISGAGVAHDLSKELKIEVGDLHGRLLSSMKRLESERSQVAKVAKK